MNINQSALIVVVGIATVFFGKHAVKAYNASQPPIECYFDKVKDLDCQTLKLLIKNNKEGGFEYSHQSQKKQKSTLTN